MRSEVVYYLFLFLSFLDDALFLTTRPTPCPNIFVKNGKAKKRQRGRFVKFICTPGYLLSGERYSTCTQGQWDPPPPKCIRPTCPVKVIPPINSLIYPSHSGAALHFFCKSGYELRGPTDVYCDGRRWDNNVPTCTPIGSRPKLSCDFEQADICGWTPDVNHDFDWKRENYNTPSGSIGTGPSFDHTKGQGKDGYYMYIESSSRSENDTARLISPIFEKTESDTCLEFFYHMYGATTGTLRVYIKKVSDSWNLDPDTAIFSKSGNQGDKWYRSYHSLGVLGEEYQIVIEGIRGPGYVSDIAIDDVKITENCVYEEETFSTSTEIPYSSTEILLTVESCTDRCGHKAFGNESQLLITCDCDEDCYFRNRCCPDYLDLCAAGTITDDYSTTTDMPNEINIDQDTPPVAPATTIAPASRPTVAVTTTRSTSKPTAAKQTTPKIIPTTTSNRPTYIPNITRKKIIPLLPTVQVLRPPTTPLIVRKVLPTSKPTPKIYKTARPKPAKPLKPKESDDNDIVDVPKSKNKDEQLLLNSSVSKDDDDSKEKWSVEMENNFESPYMRNFSESDKLLSQKMPEESHYNVVLVIISVIGVTVLTTVIAVYLAKRYRCSTRRMNYSNGESQSEIRFIINDETIDLSLDGMYDDL